MNNTGRGYFPKGVSGNPGGRPKGKSITARAREILDSRQGDRLFPGGMQVADAIAQKLVKLALDGDLKAIQVLLDRTEGRVATPIQQTTTLNVVDAMQAVEAIERAIGANDEPTTEEQS